jgi:ATP-binding cassette subfamily B protein
VTPALFIAISATLLAGLAAVVVYSLRLVRDLRRSLRDITSSAGADSQLESILGRHRRPLATLVGLAAAESALALASPWPLQVVVDNAIGRQPLPGAIHFLHGLSPAATAAAAALFGVVLVVALGVVGYAVTLLSTTVGESVGIGLRAGMVHRLLHAPLAFLDDNQSGDLVSRITTDVSRVQDSLLARVEVVIPQVIALIGMTVLMGLLSPVLALVVLAVAPGLAIAGLLRRHIVADSQRRARALSAGMNAQASELIRNVRLVRSFGQQQRSIARFDRASRDAAGSTVDATAASARISPAADVLLALDLAAVLVLGTAQVAAHHLSLGELLVFLTYLASLQSPVRALSRLASTLGRGTASAERIEEVLTSGSTLPSRPAVAATPLAHSPSGAKAGGVPGILLDRVSFSYGDREPVLSDASLAIDAGTTAVIVGASGSGKSTLLSLLMRLHDPDSGAIFYGTSDVRSIDLTSLHRLVSLVPQDAWLIAGTIEENVAFGVPDASDEEIRWAARMAHVDEFVGHLPLGWSTEVGEGGVRLSGGQRRRIALARALIARTPILLLDEPTAGLDSRSKGLVAETITASATGRTVIIATHDPELAALADAVFLVEGRTVRRTDEQPGAVVRTEQAPVAAIGTVITASPWSADSPHNLHADSTAGPSAGSFMVDIENTTERR